MQAANNAIVDRVMGVLKLDIPTYAAIERDRNATKEAAIIVGLAALAGAIGGVREGVGGVVLGIISALISWVIFSALAYFFGTQLFGRPTTQGDVEQVARVVGYAQAPRILAVFGSIPFIGWIPALVGAIWSLICVIIAIRESLEFGTGRAIITAIIAAIAVGIIMAILGLIFGVGTAIL